MPPMAPTTRTSTQTGTFCRARGSAHRRGDATLLGKGLRHFRPDVVGVHLEALREQRAGHADAHRSVVRFQNDVDGVLLERLGAPADTHWFLCGPTGFMADVQAALEGRGVPPEHIHTESFGARE